MAIYLLLNLAEKVSVEVKMQRKGIVSLLSRCLERRNVDLIILVLSFLKKLSMFKENIVDMVSYGLLLKNNQFYFFTFLDLKRSVRLKASFGVGGLVLNEYSVVEFYLKINGSTTTVYFVMLETKC